MGDHHARTQDLARLGSLRLAFAHSASLAKGDSIQSAQPPHDRCRFAPNKGRFKHPRRNGTMSQVPSIPSFMELLTGDRAQPNAQQLHEDELAKRRVRHHKLMIKRKQALLKPPVVGEAS